MLKSEEMSDSVALSVTVNTSSTQENRICLGRLNVLQGLYHHTDHGTFITTPSIAPPSPHRLWHLYHHTDHGTSITTLTMAPLSPHRPWHLYHHTEHGSFFIYKSCICWDTLQKLYCCSGQQ